jgi:hypothetical protein
VGTKKILPAGLFALVAILAVVAAVAFWLRPCERPTVKTAPARPGDAFPADKFKAAPVVEDDLTPWEKANPFHRKTRSEELLEGLPAGTEVYEFTVEEPGTERIWRSPEGDVYVEREGGIEEITAYRKPEPAAGFAFRPEVFGYVGRDAGAGSGVALARVKSFYAGPAAAYDRQGLSAGVAATWNVWRNVDVGGYGGKRLGADGWAGGAVVALAIQ